MAILGVKTDRNERLGCVASELLNPTWINQLQRKRKEQPNKTEDFNSACESSNHRIPPPSPPT